MKRWLPLAVALAAVAVWFPTLSAQRPLFTTDTAAEIAQAPFDPFRYPALANAPAFQRMWWELQRHSSPAGSVPADAKQRALETIARLNADTAPAFTPREQVTVPINGFWQNIGPAPISSGFQSYSGRVTAIAVDPSDPSHWLLGAAGGGVWERKASPWAPRTDAQVSLPIGALAFSTSHPNIVYAGTGEGNFSADSYGGGGLLKSTDGGTNWSLLAAATFAKTGFNAIRVDPINANVLVAATTRGFVNKIAPAQPQPVRGIFRSVDGGATWSLRLSGEATDIAVNPVNFSQQYGALGDPLRDEGNGIYRSFDGGAMWNPIDGPWYALEGGVGRVAFAIAPSNPSVVYVSVQDAFDSPAQAADGRLLGLWVTSDAWSASPTWTSIDITPTGGYCSDGCWYSNVLSVDPANAGILYAGGVGLWKFDGAAWTNVTQGTTCPSCAPPVFLHVDQHAMAWAGTQLLVGNDGGVFGTITGGLRWFAINTGLSIVEFYAGSLDPNGNLILGGTKGDYTVKKFGSSWELPICSGAGGCLSGSTDGGHSAFSANAPSASWVVTTPHLGIWRARGGEINGSVDAGIDKTDAVYIAPIAICPTADDVMLAGAGALWRATNFFSSTPSLPSWSSNSPHFGGGITAIAFAPSDGSCSTYAIGTSSGVIRLTTNGGGSWSDVDVSNSVPNRPIASLAFHPLDANLLFVGLSGFDEATPTQRGHVFTTSTALAAVPQWNNISPPVNLPANSVAVSSSQPAALFVGSDIGVWTSPTGGSTWLFMGPERGMPHVPVYDVKINETTGVVMAFTHGRGAFVLTSPTPQAGSVTPNSGSGSTQTFSAQFSDNVGAADLSQVYLRFSVDLSSPANSCMVRYDQTTGLLSLRDDAGAWLPGSLLPGAAIQENSQCAVNVGGSSVATSGNTLTLNVGMIFKGSYAGLKNTYLYALSAEGAATGWQLRGTWDVPLTVNAVSVSPSSGGGVTQAFTFQFAAGLGASNLSIARVRFATSSAQGAGTCSAWYDATTSMIRLMDDAGAWGSAVPLGSGALSNSQCTLNLASSSATPSGTDLALVLNMTFTQAFAGVKNIYMLAGGATPQIRRPDGC